MKKAVAVVGVTLIAILLGGAIVVAQQANTPPKRTTPYTPVELLEQANALRAEKGIAPLKLDERLNQSAQAKADDMRNGNYYGHKNPVTDKQGYMHAFEFTGYACKHAGENLDNDEVPRTGYSPFDKTFGWPASAPHYAAEIDPDNDLTGFGYVEFGGVGYYVQHFCDLE